MTPNQKLKQWRISKPITQAEFADLMGVTVHAVRKWEQGAPISLMAIKLFNCIEREGGSDGKVMDV